MSRATELKAELAKRERAEALQAELSSRRNARLLAESREEFKGQPTFVEDARASLEASGITPPRTLGAELKANYGRYTGGAIGGIVGAGGGPYGAVQGAVIGGGGGDAIQQLIEQAIGSKRAPRTGIDAARRIRDAGVREGRDEAVGQGLAKVLGKALGPLKRPFRKSLQPGRSRLSRELTEAAGRMTPEEIADLSPHTRRIFEKQGVFFTAAQKTANRPIDFIENAVGGTFFGGESLYQLKGILQPKVYKRLTKEMSEEFWDQAGKRMSPTEVGNLFLDTMKKGVDAKGSMIRVLYNNVDAITRGAKVQMTPVQRIARQLAKEAAPSKNLGSARAITTLTNKVRKWKAASSFSEAITQRSNILKEVRKLEGFLGGKDAALTRAGKKLADAVDNVMKFTAKKHSDDAYNAWRLANRAVADKHKIFGNELIRGAVKMAKKNPEKVAEHFFKPEGVTTMRQLIDATGGTNTETFKALRAGWLESVMKKTTVAKDATLMGQNFAAEITGMGDDMLSLIFPNEKHLQRILDVAETGKIIQTPIGGGGGMVAQLTQSGALIDVFVGLPTGKKPSGGSMFIILSPLGIGKILSSEGGAKWLAEGASTFGTGGKIAGKIPAQVARIIEASTNAQFNRQKMERMRQQYAPVRGQMKSPHAGATGFTAR